VGLRETVFTGVLGRSAKSESREPSVGDAERVSAREPRLGQFMACSSPIYIPRKSLFQNKFSARSADGRSWLSLPRRVIPYDSYDKVPEAIKFRALAQKKQLKIIESKDATSIIRRERDRERERDMASFDSRILGWNFEQGPENL